MTEQRPPRAFISYSHDFEEHAARVLRLANDLRRDGIEAILDQYITSPPEGWPRWMDSHVRDDDFVVMVCTETYGCADAAACGRDRARVRLPAAAISVVGALIRSGRFDWATRRSPASPPCTTVYSSPAQRGAINILELHGPSAPAP